jgi:GT2 family glycosyltransferase
MNDSLSRGNMSSPDVTIVVVPRDHFSDTEESLASILAHTPPDCPLVYVDGGSPRSVAAYLQAQAAARPFELVRFDHFLAPNHARNIGARRATTRYIVFIDNDVVVGPGWLSALVECADATGAAVVGPLNFERRPFFQHVHFAGGDARIETTEEAGVQRRRLVDRIHKTKYPESHAETDAAEFHCMLVRTDTLRRLGGLDENMLSTRENIDFCLAVRQGGETVYFEPRSRINYLPPHPLKLSDGPYFALRWSDLWDLSSFYHLRDKWNLDEDAYFHRQYENLGWRRRGIMMSNGLLRWLVSSRVRAAAERLLRPLERSVNARIARRHARTHGIALRAQQRQTDSSRPVSRSAVARATNPHA